VSSATEGNGLIRRLRPKRRRFGVFAVVIAIAAGAPSSALAYWDFQGSLADWPPPPQAEYGEFNPNTGGNWKHRLNRSNCEAKILLKFRSGGGLQQVNIPDGCADNDYTKTFPTATYDASTSRNTDTGGSNVWVNVRIAETV